jgi:hypothetical protein
MALAARIPLETLEYVSRWFFRDETLRAANRVLVDYHHSLPLSSVWGTAASPRATANVGAFNRVRCTRRCIPRYFGYYERAINVLTHTSDQHSVFAARAISCGPREALYVLDGLLENDTVLKPREHTTDTHGITEQLFGLCYLLGISFMPRFKDIADVQLYRLDTPKNGRSREVALSEAAVRALKVHRHLKGELVFTNDVGEMLTRNECRRPLWNACKRAGIRRMGWHAPRHTFASHLVMRGVPLKAVQELLGHATIEMTMRYSHLSPDVTTNAVRLLDAPAPSYGTWTAHEAAEAQNLAKSPVN